MSHRVVICGVLFTNLFSLLNPVARAAEDDPKQVVVIERRAEIVDGGKPVAHVSAGQVLRVERSTETAFRVSKPYAGEIARGAVVPLRQAIEHFTQRIKERPRDADLYVFRGRVWLALGEEEIAIGDFTEARQHDPEHVMALRMRGAAYIAMEAYESAIADYDESIIPEARDANAFNNRGMAHYGNDDFDNALADFNEAIRRDPRMGQAYQNKAWVLATCWDETIRDGKRAVRSAVRACELADWLSPRRLETLAAALARAGDFKAAAERQQQAIALAGDDYDKRGAERRLKLYQSDTPLVVGERPKEEPKPLTQ